MLPGDSWERRRLRYVFRLNSFHRKTQIRLHLQGHIHLQKSVWEDEIIRSGVTFEVGNC